MMSAPGVGVGGRLKRVQLVTRPEIRSEFGTITSERSKVWIRVARTEIEEVFRNDGNQTLEGIYRFPLPPDAL